MAATVITTEHFPLSVTEDEMKAERDLRINAGAIRSSYTKDDTQWTLTTEWNVIGQQ